MIEIGDRLFRGSSGGSGIVVNGTPWYEVRSDATQPGTLLSRLDIAEPVITGRMTLYGHEVYRISGTAINALDSIEAVGEYRGDGNDVLFIDTSDFRLVRVERTDNVSELRPETSAVDAEPLTVALEPFEYTLSMTLDFEYFDEPLAIDPPRRYHDLNGQLWVVLDDGEEVMEPVVQRPRVVTVQPTATPTPAPFPFRTFTPDDPERNVPFFLNETPYYDKLELGDDIVVSYPLCNSRNSLADRWANIMIFYMPDGSRAANGAVFSPLFDRDRPDEFSDTRYHSEEGHIAVEAVLDNPEAMRQINDYADVHVRCPVELLQFTGHKFRDLPDSDRLVINRSTVARFEPCGNKGRTLSAPILIAHLPSETMIAVTPAQDYAELVWSDDARGQELLWSLFDDTALMDRLAAMAPRPAAISC